MHPLVKKAFVAIAITIGILILVGLYTAIRHQGFDLFLMNKIFAGVAGILLGIVVLTGPFGRLFDFFDKMLIYRKWLGISAFILAYAHGIITLFLLPDKFPISRFHLGNTAFVFGLTSMLLLIILFVYSLQSTIDTLPRKFWWKLQNWGVRFAFVTGICHAVLVKLPWWQKWFHGSETTLTGTIMPPAGLIITIFLMYVLCIRFSELFPKKIAHHSVSVFTIVLGIVWLGLIVNGVRLVVFPGMPDM